MPKRISNKRLISDVKPVSEKRSRHLIFNKNRTRRPIIGRGYKKQTPLYLRSGIMHSKRRSLLKKNTKGNSKKLFFIAISLFIIFSLFIGFGIMLSSKKDKDDKNDSIVAQKNNEGQKTGNIQQETTKKQNLKEDTYQVTNASVNVRSGPGTEFDIINTLEKGDTFRGRLSEKEDWIKVIKDDNSEAYVSSNYVSIIEGEVFSGNIDIPILMYHHINGDIDDDNDDLTVPKESFKEQIQYLADAGFHTILFQDIYNYFKDNKNLPEKPIVLSFDDGYKDVYDNVFPVLKEHNYKGSFSIITDLVGQENYMNWDDVKELKNADMEITSHSKTHPDLASIAVDDARSEIFDSKKELENQLNEEINFFVYPAGSYNEETIELLKQAGYIGARSTESSTEVFGDKLYELPQLRVFGAITLDGFKWLVSQ